MTPSKTSSGKNNIGISFREEGLFVLRLVATSTSSRSSISGVSTKKLTSTLNDIY
jgi:hypothetical protein